MAKPGVNKFFFAFVFLLLGGAARQPKPSILPNAYVGEGWADLEPNPGKAREQAKARALGDLARNVHVSVQSTLLDVLGQSNDQPLQNIESRVNAQAEIFSTPLDKEEYLLHQPRRGQLTCRVAVDRVRYDARVRENLENKKNRVVDQIRGAQTALKTGRLAEALRALNEAKKRADTDLSGGPVYLDIEGTRREGMAWVTDRENEILSSLKITGAEDPVVFDERGTPHKTVPVQISWTGPQRAQRVGIPLVARWAHRPDHPVAQKTTDEQGRAVFSVRADPFLETAWLLIGFTNEHRLRVEFHRRRTLGVFVGGVDGVDKAVENRLMTCLKQFPWTVQKQSNDPQNGTNDYQLIWSLRREQSKNPDGNIFRTKIQSTVKLWSQRDDRFLWEKPGPSAEGPGGNPSQADGMACGNLLPLIAPWTEKSIQGLP